MENIYIPKKCKVGFQEREDTYTKKLAYVICQEGNKWRKELSWNGWVTKYISEEDFQKEKEVSFKNKVKRAEDYYNNAQKETNAYYRKSIEGRTLEEYLVENRLSNIDNYDFNINGKSINKEIVPFEFENIPMEGFVLNKRVGGYKSNWNHRDTYCRVYHPLGFEFEISIENVLYILDNTSSIKGKGIEGACILGWDSKDLVLIPENSPDYQEMLKFTESRSKSVRKKDFVVGGVYRKKNGDKLTFLGESNSYNYEGVLESKKFWFSEVITYSSGVKVTYFRQLSTVSSFTEFVEINPDLDSIQKELNENQYYNPKEIYKYEWINLTEDEIFKSYKDKNSCYFKDKDNYVQVYFKGSYHLSTYSGSLLLKKNTIKELVPYLFKRIKTLVND